MTRGQHTKAANDNAARALMILGRVAHKNVAASLFFAWLKHLAHGNTPTAYPGTAAMAQLLGVSRMTIYRTESLVSELGLVRFSDDSGTHEMFTLLDPPPLDEDESSLLDSVFDLTVAKASHVNQASETDTTLFDPPSIDSIEQPVSAQGPVLSSPPPEQAPVDAAPKRRRGRKMSPEYINAICANPKNMAVYLLFGEKALTDAVVNNPSETPEQQAALGVALQPFLNQPSICNWRTNSGDSDESPNYEPWTVNQWVGWFWYWVCYYRHQRGLPITLPHWGKMRGIFNNLLSTMPKERAFAYLRDVLHDHDLVCQVIGYPRAKSVSIDETLLTNPMVRSAVDKLPPWGTPERSTFRSELQSGYQSTPANRFTYGGT